MGKLLRVLVVLLLLLAVASFWLGYRLFQKRVELKDHVNALAEQIVRVAGNVEASQDPDLTVTNNPMFGPLMSLDQLRVYSADPSSTNPPNLYTALGELYGATLNQLHILNDTRNDLAMRRQEIVNFSNQVNDLTAKVAALENDKKQLQETIAQNDRELAERKTKIDELTIAIDDATRKVTDLNGVIAKQRDEIIDKEAEIQQLKDTIKKLPKPGEAGTADGAGAGTLTAGTKGQILMVNKEWNFVVIGLSNLQGVTPGLELTIQRGDKMIGVAKITDVNAEYRVAVADQLLAPWKQADAEVGDHVFH